MREDTYFKMDGLDVEYPYYININGRNWNFYSEYLKKIKSIKVDKDHEILNLVIDLGYFIGHNIVKNAPIIVTDDIRVKGDKRTYYIVDYILPDLNVAILLTNKEEVSLRTPKSRFLSKTLENLGFDVITINDLSNDSVKTIKGLKTSLDFRTPPSKSCLPVYFK